MRPSDVQPACRLFCAFVLMFALRCVAHPQVVQQDLNRNEVGFWEGRIRQPDGALRFTLEVEQTVDELQGFVGHPDLGVFRWPVKIKTSMDSFSFELRTDGGEVRYAGVVENRTVTGSVTVGNRTSPFRLRRERKPTPPYTEQELKVPSGDVSLAATLLLPRRHPPYRAVIFVHGSGGEARGGQNRFLADLFARHGIASLVYDKRGVGGSGGDWQRSTFDDLANDVLAVVSLLKSRADIDSRRIGLFASSEGAGYVSPLTIFRSPDIAYLILKSGPFVTPARQYLFEDENALRNRGLSAADIKEALEFRKVIFATALIGDWTTLRREMNRNNSKAWFDYMSPGPPDFWWWSWWKDKVDFDPVPFMTKVRVPVLALYGGADEFVPVDESRKRLQDALAAAGNKNYKITVFREADHALYVASRKGGLPRFASGYPDLVLRWIAELN